MHIRGKATRIKLFSFSSPQMRAFHLSWFAFFLCFFSWFGIAPLMSVVREELGLTKAQIGNTIIASVMITILARLIVGWCCDRFGPRRTYTWLLIVSAIPVMGIGLAHDYTSFLLFRLGIGIIGASFIITQYHTSVMFAPNCVGTANATAAGWGNLGGGVTQLVMPLLFSSLVLMGLGEYWAWRAAMFVAGLVCLLAGIAYYRFTQDLPEGNFNEVFAREGRGEKPRGTFFEACKDLRVWALAIMYGACFGVELTIDNVAALYYMDYFGLGLKGAGAMAACFGLMNLFARALGGIIGDRSGNRWGLKGRVYWLALALACEGAALMLFSRMTSLGLALGTMIFFGLFMKMSEGATYSVVPFVNKRALGAVSGIVGAGGNVGAVFAGFLFKAESVSWPTALFVLGAAVVLCAGFAGLVRFSELEETEAQADVAERLRGVDAVPESAGA